MECVKSRWTGLSKGNSHCINQIPATHFPLTSLLFPRENHPRQSEVLYPVVAIKTPPLVPNYFVYPKEKPLIFIALHMKEI